MPMLAPLTGGGASVCGHGWLMTPWSTMPETPLAMMAFDENARI